MDLTARLAELGDLAACACLFENHRAYPSDIVSALPDIWRRLLREGALNLCISEDRARPSDARIVACGASVFVTDECAQAAKRGTQPFLTARVLRQEMAGRSPILRAAAIRNANAGDGLNALVLHYAETPAGYDAAQRNALAHKSLEAFLWLHRGYRLKEVMQELCDEIGLPYILNGWARVVTDYADYYLSRGLPLPPPGERPYLTAISREDALARPGSGMASVFVYTPPRFFFSNGERRLLDRALLGETDARLACGLGLALPTVKSLWRAIYTRVGRIDPLLAGGPATELKRHLTRGLERRRYILEYLRQHPEELRPCARPAQASRRGRTA